MNQVQLLLRAARSHPARPAILHGSRVVMDYRELALRCARLAGHLRHAIGLAPGERVAICMGNHVRYLEVLYAAWWAGLAVVPINAKLHAREVEFILQDSQAGALFTSDTMAAQLQALPANVPNLRATVMPDAN